MADEPEDIIEAMTKRRMAEGISIRTLSKLVGVSWSTLARLESGKHLPDDGTVRRLREWLSRGNQKANVEVARPVPAWKRRIEERIQEAERTISVLESRLDRIAKRDRAIEVGRNNA